MKIRISSDGVSAGTKITTEDGRTLEGVTSLVVRAELNDYVRAEVGLCFIELGDIAAEARMYGPNGKEVRRIEYADGSVDEFPAS